MGIIALEQGSNDWLKYRQSKVMATDTPILLGSNPWKTKLELWEEKLGLRPAQQLNDAMKRGQELEPTARKLASEIIGIEFEPCVWESDKYPFMAASLDGLSSCGNYILEIKCPKEKTHLDAINEVIPAYYWDQMQHQLACLNDVQICYYFSYRPEYEKNPYAIIAVSPFLERRLEILEKSQEFYINMCTMNPPEEWKFKKKR
jgi:putative phage-type endonuclease